MEEIFSALFVTAPDYATRIEQDGYVIFENFLFQNEYDQLFKNVAKEDLDYAQIFNVEEEQKVEPNVTRIQSDIQNIESKGVVERVANRCLTLIEANNAHYKIVSPVYLGTLPGESDKEKEQLKHCDLKPGENGNSYAIIIYGFNGSTLKACKSCFATISGEETILDKGELNNCENLSFEAGDVIFFKSNFVHAGTPHPNAQAEVRHDTKIGSNFDQLYSKNEQDTKEIAFFFEQIREIYDLSELYLRIHAYVCYHETKTKKDKCTVTETHILEKQ